MTRDSGAERRAQKAERRAGNIRKYARPDDRGAEQRVERRAENIRAYAESRSRDESSNDDTLANIAAGYVAVVVALAGIIWIMDRVAGWFRNLVQWRVCNADTGVRPAPGDHTRAGAVWVWRMFVAR